MILSTLVTSQLHFEMCAGLYGHPGQPFPIKPHSFLSLQLPGCTLDPLHVLYSFQSLGEV